MPSAGCTLVDAIVLMCFMRSNLILCRSKNFGSQNFGGAKKPSHPHDRHAAGRRRHDTLHQDRCVEAESVSTSQPYLICRRNRGRGNQVTFNHVVGKTHYAAHILCTGVRSRHGEHSSHAFARPQRTFSIPVHSLCFNCKITQNSK